jgi:hypothetical protein
MFKMDVPVIVHREFIFHQILMFLFMNYLGKHVSEKCQALLCNYCCFLHKKAQKTFSNYFIFIFHQILMKFISKWSS